MVASLLGEGVDVVVPLLGELDDLVDDLVALLLVLLGRQAAANLLSLVHDFGLLGRQVSNASLESDSLKEASFFQLNVAPAELLLLLARIGWGWDLATGVRCGSWDGLRGSGIGLSRGTTCGGSSCLLLPEAPVGPLACALGLEGTISVVVVGRVVVAVGAVAVTSVGVTAMATVAPTGNELLELGVVVLASEEILRVHVEVFASDKLLGVHVVVVAFGKLDKAGIGSGEGGDRSSGDESSEDGESLGVHDDLDVGDDGSSRKSM